MDVLVPPRDAEVSLREVTKDNLRAVLGLKVAEDQERFVASNAVSIAQAHFTKEAWFRAVCTGDAPVGFVMLHVDEEKQSHYLWRFMIDGRYQGRWYGRRALELVIEHVCGLGATELTLSYQPGEGSPEGFYRKCGFEHTGEEDEGELVMRLGL